MRETPGYIPNPEAKPHSADGTAGGTLWESRTPPNFFVKWPPSLGGHFALTCQPHNGRPNTTGSRLTTWAFVVSAGGLRRSTQGPLLLLARTFCRFCVGICDRWGCAAWSRADIQTRRVAGSVRHLSGPRAGTQKAPGRCESLRDRAHGRGPGVVCCCP